MIPDVRAAYIEMMEKVVEPCTACEGTGYVVKRSTTSIPDDKIVKCSCKRFVEHRCKLMYAGVPPEFFEQGPWDDEYNSEARRDVMHYGGLIRRSSRHTNGLLLLGENGVGKTRSACDVLAMLTPFSRTLGYLTCRQLVTGPIEASRDEEYGEWFAERKKADVLVLDELGKEHRKEGSSWVFSEMDALLRHRRGQGSPTILITNFTIREVKATYGDSLWSITRGWLSHIRWESGDRRGHD